MDGRMQCMIACLQGSVVRVYLSLCVCVCVFVRVCVVLAADMCISSQCTIICTYIGI